MKKTKKVEAWMIVNKSSHDDIYAAYPSESEARLRMREDSTFHLRDVLRPCTITYEVPKKKLTK